MKSTPLDYASPATVRRGAVQSGLFAHVIASYVVGVVAVTWAVAAGAPFDPIMLLALVAAPVLVPLGPILEVIFNDSVPWIVLCAAYVAILALTYWYLRKPREA